MNERIAAMDWADSLREHDPPGSRRTQLHMDERLKYRVLTFLSRATGLELNHSNHGRVLKV